MIDTGQGLAVGLYRGHYRLYIVTVEQDGEFTYENVAVIPDQTTAIKVSDFLGTIFEGGDFEEDETVH